jgi:hypothetical protein
VKIIKQNLSRDHQAIVYRKDIELFALRKGNEQKENTIQERDIKLEDMARQHRAIIDVKDAQIKLLKERVITIERQSNPRFGEETEQGSALEVRLLKVRGRNLPEEEEDKDVVITRLQEQLATASKVNEEVVNQRAELQRAWDVAKKIQVALKEERRKHTKTKEQLQETSDELSKATPQSRGRRMSMPGRMPTIAENEHDKSELEAMFDSVQEDNLRLYTEMAALEKRLIEANAKMFTALQDAEALREQLRQDEEERENPRPSVVHLAHFQRMESELKEARATLAAKEQETTALHNTLSEKSQQAKDLKEEVAAAVSFHTQDQDEIERLKRTIADLEATKGQLMLDHERLAAHRTRQRVISSDRQAYSARSSDATLTQESPPLQRAPQEPAEALSPVPEAERSNSGSIQTTPRRHIRSSSTPKAIPNRWSLMSSKAPPAELRHRRGGSQGIKDFVKKTFGKDDDMGPNREPSLIQRVLHPRGDPSMDIHKRRTAFHAAASKFETVMTPESSPVPERVRPRRKSPPRYYTVNAGSRTEEGYFASGGAGRKSVGEDRPRTANVAGMERQKDRKRGSWGQTT